MTWEGSIPSRHLSNLESALNKFNFYYSAIISETIEIQSPISYLSVIDKSYQTFFNEEKDFFNWLRNNKPWLL